MLSLVVVVVGGLGSVPGALLGALLVGQVQTLGVALLPEYAPFLLFAAMLVVLAVRPAGLVSLTGGGPLSLPASLPRPAVAALLVGVAAAPFLVDEYAIQTLRGSWCSGCWR